MLLVAELRLKLMVVLQDEPGLGRRLKNSSQHRPIFAARLSVKEAHGLVTKDQQALCHGSKGSRASVARFGASPLLGKQTRCFGPLQLEALSPGHLGVHPDGFGDF